MLNKAILTKLYYNDRHSMVEIAKRFGVSRQRVHQVIFGYNAHYKTKKALSLLNQGCLKCGKKAIWLHQEKKHYEAYCKSCFWKMLKEYHLENAVTLNCMVCGKEIKLRYRKELKQLDPQLCGDCRAYGKLKRKSGRKYLRNYQKVNACLDCGKPFTKENPYKSLNRCVKCYSNYHYHHSEKRQAYHRLYYRKYIKTYSKTPGYIKYQHDYNRRPDVRERRNARQRELWANPKTHEYALEIDRQSRIRRLL